MDYNSKELQVVKGEILLVLKIEYNRAWVKKKIMNLDGFLKKF